MLKLFRDVRFKGDWELDYIHRKFQLRIGRSQIACWIGDEQRPLFNFLLNAHRSNGTCLSRPR